MSTVLILIDLQNDYFPLGKMELHESEKAVQYASCLVSFFREHQLPIFHIQHVSVRPGATFFLPDTKGAEIHPAVKPFDGEIVVQKHYPNSFRETTLLENLQRTSVQKIVVAGMMTHMCVDATVRAATDYGYECLIAHDACATRSLKFAGREVAAQDVQTTMLAALHGIYGKVMSADEIIEDMQLAI